MFTYSIGKLSKLDNFKIKNKKMNGNLIKQIANIIFRKIRIKWRVLLNYKKIRLHDVLINIQHDHIPKELKLSFYNETYELPEIKILSEHLSNQDKVMEVGAGIGFLSTFCAKKVGSENIFAYEANPFMIGKIQEIYALNNVSPTIKNTILSNKEEDIVFYMEKNFWSSSTIKRSENAKPISVKSTKINDEIELIKPSFLIIDIEGGELDLVQEIDFKNNSVKKVLIELHPEIIGNDKISKVLWTLFSNGFFLDFGSLEKRVFIFIR